MSIVEAPTVRHRLQGIDVARGLALFGMMSVHIFPRSVEDATATPAFLVAAGRSAALFAVLAGVGLALLSGGSRPSPGRIQVTRAAALGRVAVLGYFGLALGSLHAPIAIILVHYALLFLVALLFLRWRPWMLGVAAGAMAVIGPVCVFVVRRRVDSADELSPQFESLREPGRLLLDLAFTGVYPVAAWSAYVLAGLAIGRLALGRPRVAWGLLAGGAALAAASYGASSAILGGGVLERLAGSADPEALDRLRLRLVTGYLNDVPTDTAWWLAVAAPHSNTPFSFAHTLGTSTALIGLSLLLAGQGRRWLVPLAAVGAMTFTLYSSHVVAVYLWRDLASPAWTYAAHVITALAVATAWRGLVGIGPLEFVSRAAGRGTTALVHGRRPRSQ